MVLSQQKSFTLTEREVKAFLLDGLRKTVKKGVPGNALDDVKMTAGTGGESAADVMSITLEFPQETQDTNANG